MKKFLLAFFSVCLLFGGSYAYEPTEADGALLEQLYDRVDYLLEEDEKVVNLFYDRLDSTISTFDGRRFYILNELLLYMRDALFDLAEAEGDAIEYSLIQVLSDGRVDLRYPRGSIIVHLLGVDVSEGKSRQLLINVLKDEKISLRFDRLLPEGSVDEQGAYYAHVFLGEENVAVSMLEKGFATVDDQWNHSYSDHYVELESGAREEGLGLWR